MSSFSLNRRTSWRPPGGSPPGSPQPGPPDQPAPPSRGQRWRQRLATVNRRFRTPLLLLGGILIALAAMLVYDVLKSEPGRLTEKDVGNTVEQILEELPPEPSFAARAYEVIRPSVVFIHTLAPTQDRQDDPVEPSGAIGSGVIITDSGIILTSLHVIEEAPRVWVIFADGFESEAEVLLRQPENDLAVLQALVIPEGLIPATLAGSGMLQIGDEVAAVGHPFGISNSLSAGVVSGKGRNYNFPAAGQRLSNLIQFDAAVNPGNSGGPLVNRDGEVVGIVTALVNPTDQEFFVGIGLAVTIETAAGAAGEPTW